MHCGVVVDFGAKCCHLMVVYRSGSYIGGRDMAYAPLSEKLVAQFGEFRELSMQQRDTIPELKADGRVVEAVRKTRVWYPSLGLVEAKKLVDEL